MDKIITHGGKNAHFDEFLAVGMLLAEEGSIETPVFRREPAIQELNDEHTAVVDIGEAYNPELMNFDHHQNGDLPSSMGLVANHLGLETAMRGAFDWFRFKDLVDRQGPRVAAEACGIEGDIRPTQSPVESYILRTFSNQEGQVPRPLVKFMEGFGRSTIDRAREFGWKLVEAREEGEIRTIGGRKAYLRPDTEPDSQVLRTLREESGFDITLTKDPRSGDVAIYRYEDVDLDFHDAANKVEGVHFAHKSGFLANVENVTAAIDLIRHATNHS